MIKNKEDLKQYLKMDKSALGKEYKRPHFFGDDIWKFEIILRKHEYYVNTNSNFFLRKLYSFLHKKYGLKLGFSIPCNVVGAGLRINHFGLIVINENAKIGEWCDIHQGVNIGQNIEKNSVPMIGDNVWIGPGVKIFGKIEIGNNTMIGANTVVCKSFPEGNCRIAGNPARIISNEPNYYVRK
ncbi:serine acetyltransferase [Drancourtella massiliensis]|uniref:Serine acetyltransferase n=1 Tax=Drancourtella massiliensis TaxID=1632013 RepID=A0ABS2EJ41_9FIRM|nr:serine acetyltransferase [Drancourtella massiliensis]MBM6745000.1 serine acetyltransferase [Drancourtella massiliensis]